MYRFAKKFTNKFKKKVHSQTKKNTPPNVSFRTLNPMIPPNEILPENVEVPEQNKEFNKSNYAILQNQIRSYKKYKELDVKKNKKNTRLLNYGASTRENLMYTTLQDLNKEIENKAAINFYRSYILSGTIITLTGVISTALASTVILAPLAAVVGVVSSKMNSYIQTKYLWTTNNKDSFSDIDLETFMNVSKLYYRILLSPFLNKVLKKHTLLFKYGNYAVDVIKKNPNKHQEIIAKNWDDDKVFDEEYNISGWVEHQIVHSVERLSNVIEKIYALNLVSDKVQFQELYNLFMSHFNQTQILIDLYQTKYDVLKWRNDIEEKEKQVAIDSTAHIKEEFESIIQNSKIKQWFSRSTTDKYRLNKTDLNKVLELMK
jgi:hypothetical protein